MAADELIKGLSWTASNETAARARSPVIAARVEDKKVAMAVCAALKEHKVREVTFGPEEEIGGGYVIRVNDIQVETFAKIFGIAVERVPQERVPSIRVNVVEEADLPGAGRLNELVHMGNAANARRAHVVAVGAPAP